MYIILPLFCSYSFYRSLVNDNYYFNYCKLDSWKILVGVQWKVVQTKDMSN
jgi:hypothetical protein